MTMSRSHSFRLASLRRVSAFAGFMLVVFLTRIGIGMACEPHDLAELFGDPSPMALIVGVDDGDGLDPLHLGCEEVAVRLDVLQLGGGAELDVQRTPPGR